MEHNQGSGWTIDTLHEHLVSLLEQAEERFDEKFITHRTLLDSQADKVELALNAADKAVTKAETATEKRFESVNEFRQTLSDRDRLSITRVEHDGFRDAIRTELSQMRDNMNEKFSALQTRIDRTEGRGAGMGAVWGFIVGGAGVIAAVGAVALVVAK